MDDKSKKTSQNLESGLELNNAFNFYFIVVSAMNSLPLIFGLASFQRGF